ncbi:MAG: CDF family Co(II)/Ni(II) efflux transporter DmeF [Deltaproteobacteria bacterium]|nr:CDF family Co(II)/Ni(II) efflux transporter DmeF [Deltaproteobacteria bacterium]
MHIYNLHQWQHSHHFHVDDGYAERNTRRVIVLTVCMMLAEITAGILFGSMALLADGWHMGTHAIALGITAFAYYYARRHADNPQYSFGTGKVGVLGGFTSAVVLAVVAFLMVVESIKRLLLPVEIQFNEAIVVAVLGLIVNIVSAFLLQGGHSHAHRHRSDDDHHHDHNLRAAYLHVLADALTSLLAIIALFTGKSFGWVWMDPIMGIVGALLITRWSYGLLRDTGRILLDSGVRQEKMEDILSTIESDSDNKVSDIHIWPLGSHSFAVIISIVTHFPKPPEYYKDLLAGFEELEHVTVEVNEVGGNPCLIRSETVPF